MANHEESKSLLSNDAELKDEKKSTKLNSNAGESPAAIGHATYGWTVNGLPALGQGSVVGEPIDRAHWDSSLCACLGRNDHFCSSDLEVCMSIVLSLPLPLPPLFISPSLPLLNSMCYICIYTFI